MEFAMPILHCDDVHVLFPENQLANGVDLFATVHTAYIIHIYIYYTYIEMLRA